MRRGPYKLYLDRYGDSVIPRSTYFQKMKELRDAAKMQDVTSSQQHCHNDSDFLLDPMVPDGDKMKISGGLFINDKKINISITDNISRCHEEDKENENLENNTENSWLYEDYNQEEVWFDAEESPLMCENSSDVHKEGQHNIHIADDNYRQPLCNCTSVSRGEALLMTLLLGVEESLTWKTITSILSMINTLFGKNVVPDSKYQLFKILHLNEDIISYHLFCDECLFYYGEKKNQILKDWFVRIVKMLIHHLIFRFL
ncbi:uncharacterized protein LOC123260147 [Cotesia glomerata]|nr:uncharacterized protein LOC123260147 [Cotesia glomerata]